MEARGENVRDGIVLAVSVQLLLTRGQVWMRAQRRGARLIFRHDRATLRQVIFPAQAGTIWRRGQAGVFGREVRAGPGVVPSVTVEVHRRHVAERLLRVGVVTTIEVVIMSINSTVLWRKCGGALRAAVVCRRQAVAATAQLTHPATPAATRQPRIPYPGPHRETAGRNRQVDTTYKTTRMLTMPRDLSMCHSTHWGLVGPVLSSLPARHPSSSANWTSITVDIYVLIRPKQ